MQILTDAFKDSQARLFSIDIHWPHVNAGDHGHMTLWGILSCEFIWHEDVWPMKDINNFEVLQESGVEIFSHFQLN